MVRPPPLRVDDDAPLRQDTDSEDMRRTFPDLPLTAHDRNALLTQCDRLAYDRIRRDLPAFTPPGTYGAPQERLRDGGATRTPVIAEKNTRDSS